MDSRFVSIWFRYLRTDWFSLRQQNLKSIPFVLRAPSHGRMMVTAANAKAEQAGITCSMVLADARAMVPQLIVQDDIPDLFDKLMNKLAEWCIRFTPFVAVDPTGGLFLDASGCTHLWGGDFQYLTHITARLQARGYQVRTAIADTPGAAWALARYSQQTCVVNGKHIDVLMNLPPEALRLEPEVTQRLHKLGLHQIKQFVKMPRHSLRRRFGEHLISQMDKAWGQALEILTPVRPIEPYQQRLACMEPIVTSVGIEIALKQLLETLCLRLQHEQKGLRQATFIGYRIDGKVETIGIATNRPSHHVSHLFKLFQLKISTLEPALGIELFVLEAKQIEDHLAQQERMWEDAGGLEDVRLSELLDRLANKIGAHNISRFVPDEHYWPERSFKKAQSLEEKNTSAWRSDLHRPLQLVTPPEPIDVTAPIPDYPPMLFRHRGKIHKIVRADGPERIEQEWWLQQGQHRDYYRVEDEEGNRYWLFRLGHYDDTLYRWFLHGYFA